MASRIQRAAGTVEGAVESLADTLGDRLGDRLPALAEALGDRFPALSEALGERFPALARRRRSSGEDALSFVSGLLFGALAAGTAAVFLAPTDGRTLRARLVERFNTLLGYETAPAAPVGETAPTTAVPQPAGTSAGMNVTGAVVVRPTPGPLMVTETTDEPSPAGSPGTGA